MNQIATFSNYQRLPVTIDRLPEKVAIYLASAGNRLEQRGVRYSVPAECAPDERQRQYLTTRDQKLMEYCQTATSDDVDRALAKMALVLAAPVTAERVEADARLLVYSEVLAGCVSAWGLSMATDDFIAMRKGDGKWFPKPGELRSLADEKSKPMREELAKIRRLLGAEVLPAITDKNQNGVDGVRALSAKTAQSLAMFRQEIAASSLEEKGFAPDPETALSPNEWLDACAASPVRGLKLSQAAKSRVVGQ